MMPKIMADKIERGEYVELARFVVGTRTIFFLFVENVVRMVTCLMDDDGHVLKVIGVTSCTTTQFRLYRDSTDAALRRLGEIQASMPERPRRQFGARQHARADEDAS